MAVRDFHPDVLDPIGRTPREIGWLQVHCEPLARGPAGAFTAIWLQAAFEPHGDAELRFTYVTADRSERREIGRFPVPSIAPGAAARWVIQLAGVPEAISEVTLEVVAPLSEKSERVRTAWKLLETVEQRLGPGSITGTSEALAMAGALVLGGPLLAGAVVAMSSGMEERGAVTRHAPKTPLSTILTVPVREAAAPAPATGFELVWKPGQPLPDPAIAGAPAPEPFVAQPRPAAAPAAERRRCKECRCELDASDVRLGCCPGCGAVVYD